MTITQIIATQKELIQKCGEPHSFTELKNQVLSLHKQYADYVNSGGHATPYERRQVKNNMNKLLQALEEEDFEENGTVFSFSGPPIPPTSAPTTAEVSMTAELYEPTKISGLNGEIVTIGPEYARSHLYIEELRDSTVYGAKKDENRPWSIHVKNAEDSRLVLRCDGPIILHDMEAVALVLECHQLRLHNLKNCQIFANVENGRVIIEGSENLVFSGVSGGNICAPAFAVDDFDWPTLEADNPRYKMENGGHFDDAHCLLREWEENIQL